MTRLERKVASRTLRNQRIWGRMLTSERAVRLLRAELQAGRRAVRKMKQQVDRAEIVAFQNGYVQACDDLLAWLEGRMK